MRKFEKYEHLKISPAQLAQKILSSESWALQYNAFIDGSIITTRVGIADGQEVYQQFLRANNQFKDLGLYPG